MDSLKRFKYYYTSFSSLTSNQLLYHGSYRKLQQNDVISEVLFGLDTVHGIVSHGRFLIDESKNPSLAQMRHSSCDYRPVPSECADDPFSISKITFGTYSEKSFYNYDSPYYYSSSSSSWKTVLAGGLTHTITKSIPPSSSLQHLFPLPRARCPRIRIYYILRKIARWVNTSSISHQKINQKLSLPKLDALIGHSITRHHLHDALVEWYETLEPEGRCLQHLSDWLRYAQPSDNFEVPFQGSLKHQCIHLSMLMWFAFSMIHANSNDDVEVYSMRIEREKQDLFSRFSNNTFSFYSQDCSMNIKEIESESVFVGTSATWCVLSFRSVVRLISELTIHGEHPSIYGLTVPNAVHTSMTSLLVEQPIHSTVFYDEFSYSFPSSERKTTLSIVKGITVEEIIHSVQYQIIPFVTEIANIWVIGSMWIDLMNQFIERIKNIRL